MIRFTILALGVFVASVPSACLACQEHDTPGAIAVIKSFGAHIVRDEKAPGKPIVAFSLVEQNDLDDHEVVFRYRLPIQGFKDEHLSDLTGLKELRTLDLSNTKITDRSVGLIDLLSQLEWLDLSRTSISDASLETVGKLNSLTHLDLSFTEIGDEGLKELQGLKRLRTIRLTGTKITSAGLRALVGFTDLQVLELPQISDAGLEVVPALKKLEKLSLSGITDKGLEKLAGSSRLRILSVTPYQLGVTGWPLSGEPE